MFGISRQPRGCCPYRCPRRYSRSGHSVQGDTHEYTGTVNCACHYVNMLVTCYKWISTGSFCRCQTMTLYGQTSDRRITQHAHGMKPDEATERQTKDKSDGQETPTPTKTNLGVALCKATNLRRGSPSFPESVLSGRYPFLWDTQPIRLESDGLSGRICPLRSGL